MRPTPTLRLLGSRLEAQCEHQQANVRRHAEGRQDGDDVAARAEPVAVQPIVAHLREELFVAWQTLVAVGAQCMASRTLLSPEQADGQDAGAVDGKQGPNRVELGREDLEHNEGKRELPDGGAHVGAFKRPLRCADFDELGAGEHHGPRAVHAQAVAVCDVTALDAVSRAAVERPVEGCILRTWCNWACWRWEEAAAC